MSRTGILVGVPLAFRRVLLVPVCAALLAAPFPLIAAAAFSLLPPDLLLDETTFRTAGASHAAPPAPNDGRIGRPAAGHRRHCCRGSPTGTRCRRSAGPAGGRVGHARADRSAGASQAAGPLRAVPQRPHKAQRLGPEPAQATGCERQRGLCLPQQRRDDAPTAAQRQSGQAGIGPHRRQGQADRAQGALAGPQRQGVRAPADRPGQQGAALTARNRPARTQGKAGRRDHTRLAVRSHRGRTPARQRGGTAG